MPWEVMPLPFKPGRLDGLSERLIVSHYENNYGGALRRLAAIEAELQRDGAAAPGFRLNGLGREALLAQNSAMLHEVYFDALGGDGKISGALAAQIEDDFRSIDIWRQNFIAMAKALAGGSGWAILAWSARRQRLVNHWAADHAHVLAGSVPLLALDMYEHAYHLDFGADAARYVDAFMRNVDWSRLAHRFERIAREPLSAGEGMPVGDLAAALEKTLVLDVRKPEDFAKGNDRVAGAEWRDPSRVAQWAATLPKDKPVVVYCAYGFEVGRDTAASLRDAGFDARHLAGGIAAWHAAGGAVRTK